MARRRRRLSLLTRYGVTSLVLFIALGTLLGQLLQRSIEQRVLDSSLRQAEVVSMLGIQRTLVPDELGGGLTTDRVASLDQALTVTLAPLDVVEVSIWNLAGRVVFATDRATIGSQDQPSPVLAEALAGQATATIRDVSASEDPVLRRHGQVMEAYMPLRFGHGTDVPHDGVVRTTVPWAPIAATIQADTRTLYGVLAAALAVLYGILFRLVADASRTLRRQAAENAYQAMHDDLTGLANRTLFQDRLEQAVATTRRSEHRLAVMLMDLDGFKDVNDTLGHHHGDRLLQQVARRLTRTLRSSDTVARLGGDEFAVLLPDVEGAAAAVEVAQKVRAALRRPFLIGGLPLEVGGSIGIAMFPDHAGTPDVLLQRADVAMYAAKRDQRGQALYQVADDEHSQDRLLLTGELRRAIEQDELRVHYHPKHDLRTGAVVGAEALVRWEHPVRGMVAPDQFVPAAERGGLIRSLTETVLELALRDCRRWHDRGHELGVAVNLSVRNLHDPDLVATVGRLLARHGLAAAWLTLEITETMIAADPHVAQRAVAGLRRLGVRLAIDDFGTGYSSLAVLRSMPVHELKIDRSFVGDLLHSPDALAIVEFSTHLGHQLGLQVIAEGVESTDVAVRLSALGCDFAQGHGYSMPVPADELLEYQQATRDGALA